MLFEPAIFPAGRPSAQAWLFGFVEGRLLLPEGDAVALPLLAADALELAGAPALARHFLGRLGGHDCWALRLAQVPAGWREASLRAAMMALDAPLAALAGRAVQVLEWDRTHRFCGACGTATQAHRNERSRHCPACGLTVYPRISPAMMVLVWRAGAAGPQLLLARSPHYTPGMYSALAGFVEAGESVEDCIHREVAEEVGVRVDTLRYYGSQSWPFPNSLMIAFTARWVGGDIVPQEGEIEDARWFALDALPDIPPRFSISGHLIRDTVAWLGRGGA